MDLSIVSSNNTLRFFYNIFKNFLKTLLEILEEDIISKAVQEAFIARIILDFATSLDNPLFSFSFK